MAYFIINLTTGKDLFGPSTSRSCAIEQLDKIKHASPNAYVGIEAKFKHC